MSSIQPDSGVSKHRLRQRRFFLVVRSTLSCTHIYRPRGPIRHDRVRRLPATRATRERGLDGGSSRLFPMSTGPSLESLRRNLSWLPSLRIEVYNKPVFAYREEGLTNYRATVRQP